MGNTPERIFAWVYEEGSRRYHRWRGKVGPGGDGQTEYVRADLAAPRVNPLVWVECNSGNFKKGECFTARSLVDFAPLAVHKKLGGWWLNKDCKTYPTIEAAKAAAQADYEARILAALAPPEAD